MEYSQQRDVALMVLLDGFWVHGGLSRIEARRTEARFRSEGQNRLVEDLLHEGDIFGFPSYDYFWAQLFQFDLQALMVETKPMLFASTLRSAMDSWALSNWFVEPNP
jgi:hypothetical protein